MGTSTDGVTIGIDIGTTSVKALAVDDGGQVIARARVPHRVHSPQPEVFEHDAREAWVDGPRTALRALEVAEVAGVAIAAMTPSFTAVDTSGLPVTPGLLYGDHRGGAVTEPPDPLNSREVRQMLEWTAHAAPDAHGYWPAAAVAAAALGGEPVVDYSVGFALAPLWDGTWDADRLGEIGIRCEQMPPVVAADQPVGRIGDAIHVAGLADAWAEATVAGANQPGDALVICGTTLIVWATVTDPAPVPGLWTLPHPLGDHQMVAGASNSGAMFVDWVRRMLAPTTGPVHPDRVPVWVPYLRGERSPLHDAARRASLHGLDLTHQPAALMRAAYEATGFTARRMLDAAGPPPRRIVASGGGAYDAAWVQALADCIGVPVDVVAVAEGAALGAAWHARVGAGLDRLSDAGRWARYARRVEPDPAWVGPCTERYAAWQELAA